MLLRLPSYGDSCCDHTITNVSEEQANLIDGILQKLIWERRENYSQEYFQFLNEQMQPTIKEGWQQRPVSTTYNSHDHVVQANMEMNLFEFSAAKTVAAATKINQYVSESKSFREFQKKVEADGDYKKFNRAYLETERELAIATSVNAANHNYLLENSDIIKYWEYRTAGDNRVREAHANLQGKIFAWDDPVWNSIWPPNGWRCRCSVEGRDDLGGRTVTKGTEAINILDTSGVDKNGVSEWQRMKKSGFNTNRNTKQEIFDKNQMYIKNKLDYKSFGVKANGVKAYTEIAKTDIASQNRNTSYSDLDAKNWFNSKVGQFEMKELDKVRLLDYSSKPITLNKALFEKHLKQKERASYVPFIEDILKTPDEVYFNKTGTGFSLSYLKFYKEAPIKVITSIDSKAITIHSWYPLDKKTNDQIDTNERTGLLIRKKP